MEMQNGYVYGYEAREETTSNSLATDEKLTTNFIVGDFSCAVHGKTLRIWGATWFAFIAVPCPGPTSQDEAGVQRLHCIRTPFTNADRPFRTPYSVFRWPQNRFTSVNSTRWHPGNFRTSSSIIRKVFVSGRGGGGRKKSKSPYKIDPVCSWSDGIADGEEKRESWRS